MFGETETSRAGIYSMFDKVQLTLGKLRVTEKEIKEAYTKVTPNLLK